MNTATISSTTGMPGIYVRLTLMAALWAGTFVAGRILGGIMDPLLAATLRFAVAAIALVALCFLKEGGLPRLSRSQVAVTFALGATGVYLYNLAFFKALVEMPASRTALFVAFNPIFVAILVSLIFREGMRPAKWLGIGIALIGALVVISRGDLVTALTDLTSVFGVGELAMLGGVVSWGFYTIIGKKALSGLSPLAATTYAALWGLLLLSATTLIKQPQDVMATFTLPSSLSLLYLAIGGTVIPFVWFYQGVKELGAARTAVFTNFVPVFGVILGVVLLGEPLSASMLVGGALVIAGVTVTNRK